MSAANSIMQRTASMDGALLEKVILQNDFSGLTPIEKVQHIKNICISLGLNPLTKPIQLIKFQGKEIPYVTKDATEQLRKLNNVSISSLDTKLQDGIYIVTATATANGRTDSSTGVIAIKGLTGDNLANAMMKAETKAKRRATLSICGLGFLEESELDTMQGAQKITSSQAAAPLLSVVEQDTDDMLMKFASYIEDIAHCQTMDELKDIYARCLSLQLKDFPELKAQLIAAKDKRKDELSELKISDNFEEGAI